MKTYSLTLEQVNEIYNSGVNRGYWAAQGVGEPINVFDLPPYYTEED